MNTNQATQIIEGTFAYVSTGNCTQGWMIDGDDIQARANAHLLAYYGYEVEARIHQRGVTGFALIVDGHIIIDLFQTKEAAERFLSNIRA